MQFEKFNPAKSAEWQGHDSGVHWHDFLKRKPALLTMQCLTAMEQRLLSTDDWWRNQSRQCTVRRGRFLKEVEAGGRNGASKISCHCKKKKLKRFLWKKYRGESFGGIVAGRTSNIIFKKKRVFGKIDVERKTSLKSNQIARINVEFILVKNYCCNIF